MSETTIQKDFSKNLLFLTKKVTIHSLVEMIQAIWLFRKLYYKNIDKLFYLQYSEANRSS